MAYADFTSLEQVQQRFDLRMREATGRYAHIPDRVPGTVLTTTIARNLALLPISSNERMRTEFLIAPVLSEIWELAREQITLFSGAIFDVAPAEGLAGVCDFLIVNVPHTPVVTTPVVVIGEAKHGDRYNALPQCIAGMVAAGRANAQAGADGPVGGALTDGRRWVFLELTSDHAREIIIERAEYEVPRDLPRILAILTALATRTATQVAA